MPCVNVINRSRSRQYGSAGFCLGGFFYISTWKVDLTFNKNLETVRGGGSCLQRVHIAVLVLSKGVERSTFFISCTSQTTNYRGGRVFLYGYMLHARDLFDLFISFSCC